jgi:Fusaric acid resistance protein-like
VPAPAIRGAWQRIRGAGWSALETPVAAGLAWFIAHTLLGHHEPFFAPTAAAITLSKSRVLRGQAALQLLVGVVLGIGVGTAVLAVAGAAAGSAGAVAIAVAVLITLVAALAVGGGFFQAGVLFVNQSTTSAILMIAVAGAATATERLSDALIGAGVTIVITVLLFPAAPMPLIEDAAGQVFAALRDTLARLGELAPAFAALAGEISGGGTSAAEAAGRARQALALMAGEAQSGGPHAQLIARLAAACAGDTLRLTARTPIGQPDSARIYN